MATIKEDYVSFETAKLLKENGFNIPVIHGISSNNLVYTLDEPKDFNSELSAYSSQPTLQMAMKWLREVHGLFISIGNDDLDYNWQIFDINDRTKDLDPTCLTESYAGYKKYEEACEAAIKYCLKNLI